MATPDSYNQAILAYPHDDAPRLVYADFLEERGDVRGEFIRLQCALAKMSPFDDRWSECIARERRILYEHGSAWSKPSLHFMNRGFVAGLNQYSPAGIAKWGPDVFAAHPIDLIWFYYQESPGWGNEFADCEFLKNLRTIWFGGRSAYIELLDVLAMLDSPHLAGLETFCFTGDSLAGLNEDTFLELINQGGSLPPGLQDLKAFSLDLWGGGKMNDVALEALTESDLSSTLTCLSLKSQRSLDTVALEILTTSPMWERLTELDLGFQRVVPNSMAEDWTRSRLERLSVRTLSKCFADLFLTAPQWGNLTHLDLCDTDIHIEDFRRFIEHPAFAQIQDLRIERASNAHLQLLADCPNAVGLRTLHWRRSAHDSDDLLTLSGSPYCQQLCELSVDNATREGIQAFVRSPNFSRLHTLEIRSDEFGPIYEALANAENLPNLTNLIAFSQASNSGEESLPMLLASPWRSRLSYLDINEPQSAACRNALRDVEQIVWFGPHFSDVHREHRRKCSLYPKWFGEPTPPFFRWKPVH